MSQIKAWEPQADDPGGFADESALVAGLRARTPEAFEALHAAYAPSIYNLALRVVADPHEAQDVAQEVFIKVLRGLPPDDDGLTLPAWLYRVTVNAAFDHLRRRKRRPVTVAEEAAPESAATVDEYERAELAQRVETTLGELPKRQQVALVLRDVHGLSVTETASVLGVTRGSADVLLTRARAGFRRVFLAADHVRGRCGVADGILAGGVGGGVSAADRTRLEEHARTCPDCRRVAGLWSVAPVGLGLLLPQVALPGGLSLSATLAAAQAAGVVLPAGLGAAAAAGAAASAGGSGAAVSATGVSAVAGSVAAGTAAAGTAAGSAATGTGVLAALGSAAGIKIATLAAVAAAGLGVAGVASRQQPATGAETPVTAGASAGRAGQAAGEDTGGGRRDRARLLADAHRGHAPGVRGSTGGGRGTSGADARGEGGHATSQSGVAGSGSTAGGAGAKTSGSGGANGAGGTAASGAGQSGEASSGSSGSTGSGGTGAGGTGSGGGTTNGDGSGGDGSGGAGSGGSGGGQTPED